MARSNIPLLPGLPERRHGDIVPGVAVHGRLGDGGRGGAWEDKVRSGPSGQVTGQSAVVTPSNVAASASGTQTVSSVPDSLRISIGADSLTFEGCQAFLPVVTSSSACRFLGSR